MEVKWFAEKTPVELQLPCQNLDSSLRARIVKFSGLWQVWYLLFRFVY